MGKKGKKAKFITNDPDVACGYEGKKKDFMRALRESGVKIKRRRIRKLETESGVKVYKYSYVIEKGKREYALGVRVKKYWMTEKDFTAKSARKMLEKKYPDVLQKKTKDGGGTGYVVGNI